MTRLVVVRHGRTDWNGMGRFQGWTDIALDATGVAQAEAAASVLAGFEPDVLVSSDLSRAYGTALPVAQATGLEISTDTRLRERGYGPWEGLTMPEIAERWPAEHALWKGGRPVVLDGIETWDELRARTGAAIADAIAKAEGGTVMVFTHGGTSRQAVASVLAWSDEMTNTIGGLDNCRWADLSDRRGWRLNGYNVGA